ncbi:hypothetical protein [Streptomyces sp. JJ36]|uniref:hypothetical protein n=1 Tax=Streptomyces sp. JJ36 TaxID=2736645 RepID=UPI001F491E4A|nr:hypothetical protein [Streptomyces sp. JJ36]MCF6526079.1 hypothetical protein [Streptomyces sp. JJ36]
MEAHAPIVVHRPSAGGGRTVQASGRTLGTAYDASDLLAFLRLAGLDPDDAILDDPTVIEWLGGGPDVWP